MTSRSAGSLYLPSTRGLVALAGLAALSLGLAFWMRYQVIENSTVGIACDSARTWLCSSRRLAIMLFTPSVFGWSALIAALIHLWRPSTIVCAVALVAAGLGLVLYNVQLSALAAGLLIVSLARRAPEPE